MRVVQFCILLMFVAYSHAVEKYACEGNRKLLKCISGFSLKITNATFGRLTNSVCPDQTLVNFEPCQTEDAFTKVKTICDGKQYCVINATTAYFGVACKNISKYLNVKYECEKNGITLGESDTSVDTRSTSTTEEPDISTETETSPPNYKKIPLVNPHYVTTRKPTRYPNRVLPAPRPVFFPVSNNQHGFNRMNFNYPVLPPILPIFPLMPIPLFG